MGVILGTAAYMAPEQAQGQGRRSPRRHLGVRRRALRDAHGHAPVRRRDRVRRARGGPDARAGLEGAARRHAALRAPAARALPRSRSEEAPARHRRGGAPAREPGADRQRRRPGGSTRRRRPARTRGLGRGGARPRRDRDRARRSRAVHRRSTGVSLPLHLSLRFDPSDITPPSAASFHPTGSWSVPGAPAGRGVPE